MEAGKFLIIFGGGGVGLGVNINRIVVWLSVGIITLRVEV